MAPNRMAASHTTRRRPASAQAHSGRRAASSNAHTVSASGTEHSNTSTALAVVSVQEMGAA